jgi:hypothetical protein
MKKTGRRACALALSWASCLTLAMAQPANGLPMVDYRLAPLEQARKLHAARGGDGPTMTIMNLRTSSTAGDYTHLILTDPVEIPLDVASQLRSFDSVTWRPGGGVLSSSACDSQAACERRTDEMCDAAGHGGVVSSTVHVAQNTDGTRTCSGNCQTAGAIAFVTCGASNCLLCN